MRSVIHGNHSNEKLTTIRMHTYAALISRAVFALLGPIVDRVLVIVAQQFGQHTFRYMCSFV